RAVLLLEVELQKGALQPGVDVPVDAAQVVAVAVGAEIGELDRLAALDAAPLAAQHARAHPARGDLQPPQLAQEGLVEGGVARPRRLRARHARLSDAVMASSPLVARICHGLLGHADEPAEGEPIRTAAAAAGARGSRLALPLLPQGEDRPRAAGLNHARLV